MRLGGRSSDVLQPMKARMYFLDFLGPASGASGARMAIEVLLTLHVGHVDGRMFCLSILDGINAVLSSTLEVQGCT